MILLFSIFNKTSNLYHFLLEKYDQKKVLKTRITELFFTCLISAVFNNQKFFPRIITGLLPRYSFLLPGSFRGLIVRIVPPGPSPPSPWFWSAIFSQFFCCTSERLLLPACRLLCLSVFFQGTIAGRYGGNVLKDYCSAIILTFFTTGFSQKD